MDSERRYPPRLIKGNELLDLVRPAARRYSIGAIGAVLDHYLRESLGELMYDPIEGHVGFGLYSCTKG